MNIQVILLATLVVLLCLDAAVAWVSSSKARIILKRGLPKTLEMSIAPSISTTGVTEAKRQLRDIGIKTSNGLQASAEDHANAQRLVGEIAKGASMPTSTLEYASRMEGSWTLTYTTNRKFHAICRLSESERCMSGLIRTGEFSSGKVGPFIGQVVQRVDTANLKYYNDLSVFNGLVSATLQGTWEELGEASATERQWKIVFLDVALRLFGLPVKQQSMLGASLRLALTCTPSNSSMYVLRQCGSVAHGVPGPGHAHLLRPQLQQERRRRERLRALSSLASTWLSVMFIHVAVFVSNVCVCM